MKVTIEAGEHAPVRADSSSGISEDDRATSDRMSRCDVEAMLGPAAFNLGRRYGLPTPTHRVRGWGPERGTEHIYSRGAVTRWRDDVVRAARTVKTAGTAAFTESDDRMLRGDVQELLGIAVFELAAYCGVPAPVHSRFCGAGVGTEFIYSRAEMIRWRDEFVTFARMLNT